MPPCVPVRKTMPQDMITTTTVRIAVARFEFTPSIPIFAKIEVSAAKTADSSAKISHITISPVSVSSIDKKRRGFDGQ